MSIGLEGERDGEGLMFGELKEERGDEFGGLVCDIRAGNGVWGLGRRKG